jgi:hypothetical protein
LDDLTRPATELEADLTRQFGLEPAAVPVERGL